MGSRIIFNVNFIHINILSIFFYITRFCSLSFLKQEIIENADIEISAIMEDIACQCTQKK